MPGIPGIRSLFRLPLSEERVASDVEEEIAFHIEERVRELTARGMAPAAARTAALREFGDVGEARAELERMGRRRVRRQHRTGWWSDLRRDAGYAVRSLRRSPGFALVAVLTLALRIGATTAIYTVVGAVLLHPLGVAEPDRLVMLREWRASRGEPPVGRAGTVSAANFFDWREQARSFSSMSYFYEGPVTLAGDGEPQVAQAQLVSADFFTTLGVQPILGRTFLPEEGAPGAQPSTVGSVVVLGHGLWTTRYGADPGMVGRTIRVDGGPLTVVGVMGPDLRFPARKADLWIPLGLQAGNRVDLGRFLTAVGRLAPGVTEEQAWTEMDAVARRLEAAYPENNTDMRVWMTPLTDEVVAQVRPALLVLLASVAMLLLIACTNVANLLLARATTRRQEIAMRLSLGATRGRVARQLLVESLVLALIGGAVGVTVAAVGTRALVRSLPPSVQLPRLDDVVVDGRVLLVALGITLLTGLLFGLGPALVAARGDLQGSLRDGIRGHTGSRAPMRLRSTLVAAEVALALVLLVGAGLLLRSFQQLQQVDSGMRAEGVLTARLGVAGEAYATPDGLRGFMDRLLPALEGLPGVEAVGTIQYLPLADAKSRTSAWRADRPVPAVGESPSADIRVVGGDYFAAQGVRLVRGRWFDARDNADAPVAFVINEQLAREQFPGEDPVGKRLVYGWDRDIEGEIVGVVEDVHETSLTEPAASAIYRPFVQDPWPSVNVLVRTTGDPLALAGAVRVRVREIDPNLPVASVRSMQSVMDEATARTRLSGYLLGGFAGLALLLAAIGLYGVISYGVMQRRSEIGVRVALGAERADILRLVVGQGMLMTALGLAVGLVGAVALARLLRSLLFGVTATDPATFLVVPALLALVALVASYFPASRAAKVDPAVALRGQ